MNVVMVGPNGGRLNGKGVFLEIEPQSRLTFTDAYTEEPPSPPKGIS